MSTLVIIFNVFAFFALFIGFVFIVSNKTLEDEYRWAKFTLLISISIYMFIVVSNILEHWGITSFFDSIEDIAEIFFIIVFLSFINNWRLSRALAISNNRKNWLKFSLESIAIGIVTLDNHDSILSLNKKMITMANINPNNVLGRNIFEILSLYVKETKRRIDIDQLKNIIASGSSDLFPEGIYLKNENEKYTLVKIDTSSIISEEGKKLGTLISLYDIGDYYSLVEQLNHTRKLESLGQLAGGVAHDLNNMLGGIMGAADVLRMNYSEKDSENDMVDLIIEASENAKELTADLLAFGRKGKIISSPIDIVEIVYKSVAIAKRTISKSITIKVSSSKKSLTVVGDPSQLQNVFLNLIINSKDAMNGIGKIDIDISEISLDKDKKTDFDFQQDSDDYILIKVSDNGGGIPNDIIGKIFEPFFTTKKEGSGTGLGLAAVYGTIKAHHGSISVNNTNDGCSFNIYLPNVVLDKVHSLDKNINLSINEKFDYSVLIIEDELAIRRTTKMMIEQQGSKCFIADSGVNGLKILQNNDDIDIVLLDMVMPGMGGAETLKAIKKMKPELPVLITSGFTQNREIAKISDGFLKKPFRTNELIESLNILIARNKKKYVY